MAVEMVILVPVLMMFVLLVVLFGRYVTVRGDIDAAARDAARAGSMEFTLDEARARAQNVMNQQLDQQSTCAAADVGRSDWRAGGVFIVRLTCEVSYESLGLIGLKGTKTVTTESAAPLDPYRSFQ